MESAGADTVVGVGPLSLAGLCPKLEVVWREALCSRANWKGTGRYATPGLRGKFPATKGRAHFHLKSTTSHLGERQKRRETRKGKDSCNSAGL
jgi:hypothetical protein